MPGHDSLLRIISLLVLATVAALPLSARGETIEPGTAVPGEILVMLESGIEKVGEAGLEAVLHRHSAKVVGERRRPTGNVLKLRTADADVLPLVNELNAGGAVRAASPNYLLSLQSLPNDPMLGLQWYIQDAGDADVDLPEAWDIATGDPGVVIAIIDTGVDWTHPDLLGTVWQNLDEIGGNGIDDDGNGWVDDLHGWDCGNGDPDARPEVFLENGLDVGFHGTHCAGIAVAAADNGVGIAGAGRGCSLMGLKVNDSAGLITVESLTEAVDYAVINGADVVSMSFGGTFAEFAFMQALMDDANAAGVVCVAAAGNGGDNVPVYPAALDGVIAVGATDNLDQRATFSTYGDWIDVAAPGQQIWSTVQTNYQWDALTQLLYSLTFGWDGIEPYMYSDGTSMAAPLVAGVCGLVRSVRPDFTPAQVHARLVATGEPLVFDQPIGVKLDARAALEGLAASAVDGIPAAGLELRGNHPNPFNPSTTIALALDAERRVRVDVFDVRGRHVRRLLDRTLGGGAHGVEWNGRGDDGADLPSGTYLYRVRAGGRSRTGSMQLIR